MIADGTGVTVAIEGMNELAGNPNFIRPDGEHVVELDPQTAYGTSDTLISEAAIRGMYRYWREVMDL